MQVQLTRCAGLSLALAVGVSLGACKGERHAPAVSDSAGGAVGAPVPADTASSSGAMDTTGAMGADTTAMGGNASGSLAGLSDANYAALVDEVNKADRVAGALAATKGTDATVKAFGQRMMADHHALRVQGEQLVTQLNLTPEAPQNDQLKALATKAQPIIQNHLDRAQSIQKTLTSAS